MATIIYDLTIITDNSEGTVTDEVLAEALDSVLTRIREIRTQVGNALVVVDSVIAQD
jgi:hypothetical protein